MPQKRESPAAAGAAAEKHEKARQLTEQALDEYVKGNTKSGDQLVEQAKQIDRTAVEEVVQELEEDAAQRGEQ